MPKMPQKPIQHNKDFDPLNNNAVWTQNNPRQICKSIQSSAKQNSASVQKHTEVSAPAWSLPHLAPSPLPSPQHRAVQVMEWDTTYLSFSEA